MTQEIDITWGRNRNLVQRLSESGARFLVVGGTAVQFHNPERPKPKDLDLLLEPSAEMLEKLNAALVSVGEPIVTTSPEEFAKPNKRDSRNSLKLDLMTPPDGVTFSEHWAAAEEAIMTYSQVSVRVASNGTLQMLLRKAQACEPNRKDDFEKDLAFLERALPRPRS